MAGFLRRWFGGKDEPTSRAVEAARDELDRRTADRPDLQPLALWLRPLLPELEPATDLPLPVSLTPEAVRDKLARGVPALRGERLSLDESAFRRRWARTCAARSETAAPLEPGFAIEAVLAGELDRVRDRAASLGVDPSFAMTILRACLFPVFASLETGLAPIRGSYPWPQGYCPTCGSWPTLAEFRGLDQSRFLRCGLCSAGWEAPRLWCPFCGNGDHERLGFLQVEGAEVRERVAVCDTCRGFVKTVTTLLPHAPLQLWVTDAATLHMDLAAMERGYMNPPLFEAAD